MEEWRMCRISFPGILKYSYKCKIKSEKNEGKEKRTGLRKISIFSGLLQIVQMESLHMKFFVF